MSDPLETSLLDLARAFPSPAVAPATLEVYRRNLGDLDADAVARAIVALIRRNDYFPRVAEIRRLVAEETLALPSEAEALEQIAARIRWSREPDEARGPVPAMNPLVRRALDLVGGAHAFRAADDPGVVRGQFLRLYRDERARALGVALTGR